MYCIVLCCAVLRCAVLCLCCAVLCCAVLIALHCTALHCINTGKHQTAQHNGTPAFSSLLPTAAAQWSRHWVPPYLCDSRWFLAQVSCSNSSDIYFLSWGLCKSNYNKKSSAGTRESNDPFSEPLLEILEEAEVIELRKTQVDTISITHTSMHHTLVW